jgi:four helix bundle protein
VEAFKETEMSITRFTQLKVWEKAHHLTLAIYRQTAGFPADERFGLTSQMRRAAVSVPANIAEGFARSTSPDRARFYGMARSSAEELKYYLILGKDLGYPATWGPLGASLDEVCAMLFRLWEGALHHRIRP